MPSALIDKIRRAREQRVPVGAHTFVVRRPTDLEMIRLQQSVSAEAMLQFVVGWEGVTEGDVVNGGGPHPLPFDADVCAEWLADRMDLFGPVVAAITTAYQAHQRAQDAAVKN